mmetsp:Transcript_21341/g.53757  ORF Transcript_21341/g.53757 Transcript_21341/m.53757 type:complete len:458 (-) Transcript_21341:84-1457(-)
MVLDAERLHGGVHHAGAGAIVEVDVCHLHTLGQRGGVDRKVMVLRADLDATCGHVANGVVAAVVAEGQLEGLGAEGLAKDLVAHADAKHGQLAHNLLGGVHGVGHGGGITGAVAEEHAIRVHGEHLRGRGASGHNGNVAPERRKAAQDVGLDAKVVGHNLVFLTVALRVGGLGPENEASLPLLGGGLGVLVSLLAGDLGDEVLANNGPLLGLGHQLLHGGGHVSGDDTVQAAGVAKAASDFACVHARDADDTILLQKGIQGGLRAVVGDGKGVVADDNRFQVHGVGLHVTRVDASVADVGMGEGDALALVAGVGQDLLVARERGIEHDLRQPRAFRAEVVTGELGAVLHHQAAIVLLPGASGGGDDCAAAAGRGPEGRGGTSPAIGQRRGVAGEGRAGCGAGGGQGGARGGHDCAGGGLARRSDGRRGEGGGGLHGSHPFEVARGWSGGSGEARGVG